MQQIPNSPYLFKWLKTSTRTENSISNNFSTAKGKGDVQAYLKYFRKCSDTIEEKMQKDGGSENNIFIR